MQRIQWQDRFNIGVEVIDQAHRGLFAIVQKIMDLYVERHEDKFACVEGIKYFKAYAVKHFAEEEAYMRKIGYPGLLAHKKVHDRMKWETLPELDRLLHETDFSTEAVQRFIGVCTGWLTGHILIEDRAIISERPDEAFPIGQDDEASVIYTMIVRPLREIFGCNVHYIGRFSAKDEIVNAQYYELRYSTQDGKLLRVILVMGESMLLHAAGVLFDIDFYERNEIVCFAMQEIAQNLIQRAASRLGRPLDEYQLERGYFLTHEAFSEIFRERPAQHSLLFQVEQECFALCIDQDPAPEAFAAPGAGEPV